MLETIGIYANGTKVLEFKSPNFEYGNVPGDRYFKGCTAIGVNVGTSEDPRWLRFDAGIPPDTHLVTDLTQERFTFDIRVSDNAAGAMGTQSPWDIILSKGQHASFCWRWAHPLSPAGQGLLFRLVVGWQGDIFGFVDDAKIAWRPPNFSSKAWKVRKKALFKWSNSVYPLAELEDVFRANYVLAETATDLAPEFPLVFRQQSGQPGSMFATNISQVQFQLRLALLEDVPALVVGQTNTPDPQNPAVRAVAAAFGIGNASDGCGPVPYCDPIQLTGVAADDGYHIELDGIAGAALPGQLSLPALWKATTAHYGRGLATAHPHSCLSFLPTTIALSTANANDRAAFGLMRFVANDDGSVVSPVLIGVQANAPTNLSLLCECGYARDLNRIPMKISVPASSAAPQQNLHDSAADGASWFRVGPTRLSCNALSVGIGSAALTLKSGGSASIDVRRLPHVADNLPSTMAFRLEFEFAGDVPSPLSSDDPDPTARSLVVDSSITDNDATRVNVTEQSGDGLGDPVPAGARQLSVKVFLNAAGEICYDVTVLSLTPFALTRSVANAPSSDTLLFASFTDGPGASAAWQFAAPGGQWDLWLPPQAIGEEMVKGPTQINNAPRPYTDRPFDTRLSPPAHLRIDSTPINTARSIAPWDIAQVMDIRAGTVGARIVRADFELLYGLSAGYAPEDAADVPPTFVASWTALIGTPRIPASVASPFASAAVSAYRDEVARQIAGLTSFPSQWQTFRQWGDRRAVTLDCIKFALRETRECANPFAPASLANGTIPSPDREPLRGGIDFGFESRAIYSEFLDAKDGRGTVKGLAFGALGGSGDQHAYFANGKTQILTSTTQGRIDNLTIIRLGRIARLWNKARHVIVYERSTRTAPRYSHGIADQDVVQPDDFEGLAALRKVREYVEITEPTRRYPDHGDPGSRANGPLLACHFDTVVVPVKPTWARDIKDGYTVPLRGPLRLAEGPFYPFPKIFQRFARAPGKGDGFVDHLVEDPAELTFFSSTRIEDGADSDAWAPVPGLDFSVLGAPAAVDLDATSQGDSTARLPNAAQFEPGDRIVSTRLIAPPEASDLLHNRVGQGIEARIHSMTLARGQARSIPITPQQTAVRDATRTASVQVEDALHQIRIALDVGKRTSARSLDQLPPMRQAIKAQVAALKTHGSQLAQAYLGSGDLLKQGKDWLALQREAIDACKVALEQELRQTWATLIKSVRDQVASELTHPETLSAARLSLHNLIDQILALGTTRLGSTRSVLDAIASNGHRMASQTRDAVQQLLAEQRTRVEAAIERARGELALRGDEAIRSMCDLLTKVTSDLADIRQDQVRRVHEALDPWFGASTSDWPHPVLFEFDVSFLAPIAESAIAIEDEGRILAVDAIGQSVATATAALDALEARLPEILDLADASDTVEATVDDAIGQFRITDSNGTSWPFEDWFDLQLAQAQDAFEDECTALWDSIKDLDATALLGVLGNFGDSLLTQVRGLSDQVASTIGKVVNDLATSDAWQAVQGQFNRALDGAQKIEQIAASLETTLADGAAAIDDLIDTVGDHIDDALEQLRGAQEHATQALNDALVAGADSVAGIAENALQTTRLLADGPINDLIASNRQQIAYYLDEARDYLSNTPAAAIVNNLGDQVLNGLSMAVPFTQLRERLIPDIGDLSVKSLLPDFGGLKLGLLLDDLGIPRDSTDFPYSWLKVTHGFDAERHNAYASIDMDKQFEGEATLINLSPIELRIHGARFVAHSSLVVQADGRRSQETSGALTADWGMYVSGQSLATVENGTLSYDGGGGLDFHFEPSDLKLAPALQFLTDAMRTLMPSADGLTITPLLPGGISAAMCIPLPDITTGACTLTGLTLNFHFDLSVVSGFEVKTGVWLSRPDRPFGLAIAFLGGGGWLGVDIGYKPPGFSTHASFGIAAGAFAALNLGGIARGSAGLLFTAAIDYTHEQPGSNKGGIALSVGILIWGEFDVLGIISASLRIVLRIAYDGASMIGFGTISVSVRICWCYTLHVDRSFQKQLAGSSNSSSHAMALKTPGATEPPAKRIEKATDRYLAALV